jgi:hypothetical protein
MFMRQVAFLLMLFLGVGCEPLQTLFQEKRAAQMPPPASTVSTHPKSDFDRCRDAFDHSS